MRYDSKNIKILQHVEKLMDNGISIVLRSKDEAYIYKRSIPFLIENEIWMLNHLTSSGFTPFATRHDKYTIVMPNLGVSEKVTDVDKFMANGHRLKMVLLTYAVRHGDITPPNIIVKDNFPYVLDWAEARLHRDIRPDKRSGGDDFWIDKTWSEIIENSK